MLLGYPELICSDCILLSTITDVLAFCAETEFVTPAAIIAAIAQAMVIITFFMAILLSE
jgi:hypothetical protein